MARPLLSVLVDTYNHEKFIEQAVVSVLEQEFPMNAVEILVVDDGSTDRTPEILKKFEPRIRNLRKTNGGQASAFNLGIPECQGEIVAFLDGDDWWTPNKLQVLAAAMDIDACVGMAGHAFDMVSNSSFAPVISPGRKVHLDLNDFNSAHAFRLHRCYLGTSRLALRREIAHKCLPIPECLVFEADEYLFTVAAAIGGGFILPEVLTHYRIHGGNLYLAPGGSLEGERQKQRVLSSLAAELRGALSFLNVPMAAAEAVVEMVELEATQLRLRLDGGSSWETFQ